MRRTILMIAAVVATCGLTAQSFGEIQGRVLDANGDPMPAVAIMLEAGGKQIGEYTDGEGKYKIKPLKPGVYSLVASFIGYKDQPVQNLEVYADQICKVPEITLIEDSEVFDPIIIVGGQDLINPEETSKISIRMTELEHSPAQKSISQIIGLITPTAYQDPNDGELYFKGARRGANVYYIDGVKIHGNVPQIPSSGIGSITVYTGGVPASYGDATGGFVVIETKNFYDAMNR